MLHPFPDSLEEFTTHTQWATATSLVRDRPPHTANDGVMLLDPVRSGFSPDDRVLATWSNSRYHPGNPEGVDYSTLVVVHPDGCVTLLSAGAEPQAKRIHLRDVRKATIRRWLWLGEQSAAHALRSDLTVGASTCGL